MKAITLSMMLIMLTVFAIPSFAADTSETEYWLGESAEWPFSLESYYLKSGMNALASGTDLMFWAIGDTVTVIDKTAFSQISSFRVATIFGVQDMLFDEDRNLLYVAAGYDEADQSGGLQIFDVSDPSNPGLIKVFDKAPDNPGSRRSADSEYVGVDVPDIDARGVGLSGDVLFLADDNFGLRAINVSDPLNPVEVTLTEQTEERISGYKQPNINGSYVATGGYVNLALYPYNGSVYAFVLDYFYGVKMFDVTDPAAISDPVGKQTLSYVNYGGYSLLSDIYVNETQGRLTAYVTGGDLIDYAVVRLNVVPPEGDNTPSITNF